MTYGNSWAPDSVEGGSVDSGLWPSGNYTGNLLRHECGASAVKGTNYIRLWFAVNGVEKPVDIWITEAAATMAMDRLAKVGWNGEWPECEFSICEGIALYMKHEVYKGKTKERWDISTFESKPVDGSAMARFAQRFKASNSRPAPAPSAPPSAPPRPAQKSAAPSAPPRPAAKAAAVEYNQDSAWAAWAEELGDKCDAGAFWAAVDRVRGEREVEQMTAKDWADVVAACPPF